MKLKKYGIIPLALGAYLAIAALPAAQAQTKVEVKPSAGSTTTEVTDTRDGQTTITVTVNNEAVAFEGSAQPRLFGGRVMVPLRGVVERLGGNIKYEAATKVINGAHPNLEKQFRLRVGSTEALVNGQTQVMDTQPRVVAGITYVPLRFVSETMGADVRWDAARRTVVIMANGQAAEVKTQS